MNLEAALITKVLEERDVTKAINGKVANSIQFHKDIWNFIENYYMKYRTSPTLDIIKDKFPDFDPEHTEATLEYLIDEVNNEYLRFRIEDLLVNSSRMLEENPREALEYIFAKSSVLGYQTDVVRDRDLANEYWLRVNSLRERAELSDNGKQILGIPSGIPQLDLLFGGWQKGDFIVIMGWTGSGKTWFATYLATHAWKMGYKPMYVSLEMDDIQIGYRVDTLLGGGSLSNTGLINARNINIDSYEDWAAKTYPGKQPFWIVTNEGLDEITQTTIQMKIEQYRPDMVVCHKKGTMIFDEGKWMRVEEHPTAIERVSEGVEVRLRGIPFSEIVTHEHRYWARFVDFKERIRIVNRILDWKSRGKDYLKENPDIADSYLNIRGVDGWVEAKDLTSSHYIGFPIDYEVIEPQPIENKIRSKVIKYVPDEFYDKDWWWFFGYWWGDGNLNQNRVEVSIADNDTETFERITSLLSNKKYLVRQLNGCKKVSFCNVALARWLRTWRVGNSMKCPPDWVERIDFTYQRALVDGYFAADGSRDTDRRRSIVSVHLPGLLALRRILARLGVSSSIYKSAAPGIREFPNGIVSETKQTYALVSYDDAGNGMRSAFIDSGFLWTRVKSVTPIGQDVFVPIQTNSHTYLTDFGMSHNCDYHALISDSRRGSSETERHRNLSKDFKRMAVRYGIPIIDIVAVTMEEGHDSRAPELNEVAWSKQLAYDSDLVLSLFRSGQLVTVEAKKSRRSELFAFKATWDWDAGVFTVHDW
jgi:hypothetical protein